MKKYLDSSSKTNEIRLLLKHPSYKESLIVVLEGGTDVRLFRSLLSSSSVCFESVNGKVDLINVMRDLKCEDKLPVIAICDADFDHIREITNERELLDIYLTDTHDAETMLVDSPALRSFIDEYTNHDNHSEIVGQLKDSVLSTAYEIGLFRLVNIQENFNLNMKRMNYNSFIDVNKLLIELDVDQFLTHVVSRSASIKDGVDKELILDRYRIEKKSNHSILQVCCGHDIASIIAMVYSQRWVSCVSNVNKDKVESALRIAYTIDHFKETSLFQKLLKATAKYGFEYNDANNSIQRTAKSGAALCF